ncbi:MAG TPA: LysR substrate-binding domain-containing protein, partial [Paracoccaceae bacterium]|nr:LysR substrate-binding domain-containing protein [Paracoccaceae bacterium]
TAAGRLFLSEARAVLARAEEAELVLGEVTGLKRGTLHLAASQTAGNYWLPPIMHRFRERHPGIRLTLRIANTSQVAESVADGTVDLGFVEDRIENPLLLLGQVATDRLLLVAAPHHPLAAQAAFGRKELAEAQWVLRERGSGTRALFEAALQGFGLSIGHLNVALELPSNEAVRTAVEAGAGASVLSCLVVGPSIEAGRLRSLGLALPDRGFHSLRHGRRHQSRSSRAFLDVAAAHADGRD